MMDLDDTLAKLLKPTAPISKGSPVRALPEAPAWASATRERVPFERLMWLDGQLVTGGFPSMSPWWRAELSRFYASGKRWGVYLVGRGGGKSTTLTRVAVAESLFTERAVPPGQRWIWPFVSVGTADSRRRITEIGAILRAIGVEAEAKQIQGQPTIATEDARGNAIAFVAIAGTISAVSGPTSIGATIDEEAKLKDRDSNANPARELIASILQTFRARPGIRGIRCSSAWDEKSSHAAAVHEGDTEANHVGRIGLAFLDAARDGFLDVAAWEEQHNDVNAAKTIRVYATTLTAESPRIPTWLANPTIGAVASRLEVEAVPATALGGMSRTAYWLRENGSVTSSPKVERTGVDRASWAGFLELNATMPAPPFDVEIA
jgi:hypothetical protein